MSNETSSKKKKVAIVHGRCSHTQKDFGIRFEWTESGWIADWAFPLKPGLASREGYETTRLEGLFQFAEAYPGCPNCENSSICLCECTKVACWDGQTTTVDCPWCQRRLTLEGIVRSLVAGQDR